jgi:hypothetical protein
MKGRDILRGAIFSLGVAALAMHPWSAGQCAAEVVSKTEDLDVTPSLVREIQFMLLRLGMEPGPIDGIVGPQTTRAWGKFQQDSGRKGIWSMPAKSRRPPWRACGVKRRGSSSRARKSRRRLPRAQRHRPLRSRRHSRLPSRPIASPRALSMPKISGSERRNTHPKNTCRKASRVRRRARLQC